MSILTQGLVRSGPKRRARRAHPACSRRHEECAAERREEQGHRQAGRPDVLSGRYWPWAEAHSEPCVSAACAACIASLACQPAHRYCLGFAGIALLMNTSSIQHVLPRSRRWRQGDGAAEVRQHLHRGGLEHDVSSTAGALLGLQGAGCCFRCAAWPCPFSVLHCARMLHQAINKAREVLAD